MAYSKNTLQLYIILIHSTQVIALQQDAHLPNDNRPGIEHTNPDRVPPGGYGLLHPVIGLHSAQGARVQHKLAVLVDGDEVRVGPLGV